MIVEFVGSTGAGKSTIASEVQRRLGGQPYAIASADLATELVGLRPVTRPTARNVIQDIVGLPFSLGSLHEHRAFASFAIQTVIREHRVSFATANYIRSIVRRIGMYELAKRHDHGRIVLVDEGTVLSAHLLFVYTRAGSDQRGLAQFARLVPLPELIVYVKVPADILVRRALQRSDARRELRSKDRKIVEGHIDRAVKVFDDLMEMDRIRDRVLVVENPPATEAEIGTRAERVARFALSCASSEDKHIDLSNQLPETTVTMGGIRASYD